MKKLLFIFGTRPEAIKMAPIIKEFLLYRSEVETKVCVTAQHREMLDQVLRLFEIVPDYDLDIMKKDQDLFDITSNILDGLKHILEEYKPDIIFVHGDTTTTFASSLAGFYKKIDIAHIEAGLRTNNIYSPWPEEANRKLTTQITKYHFAPTIESKENLLRENVKEANIIVTGNSVIDSLLLIINRIKSDKKLENSITRKLSSQYLINNKKFILVTGHRRENFGEGFINICKALQSIAKQYKNIDIVYPVHLNPNVRKPILDILGNIVNIHLIEPLEYLEFVYLMSKSYIILTDSGGVQEEAPSLGKPVLVMRDTTERTEALKAGTVKLVGTNKEKIIASIQNLLNNKKEYQKMFKAYNPYGDGKCSETIRKYIIKELC